MKKTNKNDCSTIDVKINKIKESSKKMKIQ